MKKPQCEKPTSYNCGQACINLSKSCQQSPSDSFGRSRLQKLKQVAAIYAKSKGVKNNKSKESVDKLISNITIKRNAEAKALSEDRKEINETRRRTRLKAEAEAKRKELSGLYDQFYGKADKKKTWVKEGLKYALDQDSPAMSVKATAKSVKESCQKLAKTNPKGAKIYAEQERKNLTELNKEVVSFLEKSRKLIEVKKPTPVNAKIESNSPGSHDKGVKAFSRMISIPNLKDPVTIVDTSEGSGLQESSSSLKGRSFYRGNSNQVFMANKDPAVVVHEMSHWLEEKIPGVREEVQAFYDKRTQGEKLVKLSSVTEGKNYGDNEVTKVDKWLNPYMGKEYKNASEILSMGMEMMYRNPAYLAKNDPEMFDFIYSVVRRG